MGTANGTAGPGGGRNRRRSGSRTACAQTNRLLIRCRCMALVELRNVSKIYHLGGEEIRALDDLSMDIELGEFISIIGPSGSGKSTLMHILGCLDSPTHGTLK